MKIKYFFPWFCLSVVIITFALYFTIVHGNSQPTPTCGIAILASNIGSTYPVEPLVEFIDNCGFSIVVVDWAWITYHWDRTDFEKLNKLIRTLKTKGIEVPAMYRPRFLSNPTVPTQVKENGLRAFSHGYHICFSSEESREWGYSWGEKILEKCPEFDEIIIYNPLDICECPQCQYNRSKDRYAQVWNFLAEARKVWRQKKPSVKLGVVYMPEYKDFWERGINIIDSARPFLYLREDIDIKKNIDDVKAIHNILGNKVKASLAKITWGKDDKVSKEKLSNFTQLAQQNKISYFFWTFDTLFLSSKYNPREVSQILDLDYNRIKKALGKMTFL